MNTDAPAHRAGGGGAGARSWWREQTGRNPWLRSFVTLVVLTFLGQMATAPGQSLLSVYVEARLGRPPSFTSALVSTQLALGAIAAILGGGLADTRGRRRVMLFGATGLPLVGVAFLLRSPAALLLLWAYAGFALALYVLGRQAYTMALVPPRRLGVAFAVLFTGVTLGGAAGNLFAGRLVDGLGFSALGVTSMAVALLVLVLLRPALPEIGDAEHGSSEGTLSGYVAMLRQPRTLLLASLQAVPTVYYGASLLLMPLLIYRASGSASIAAYYATTNLVCASVGQLLAGRLMDRVGARRPTVVLIGLIAAIALATSALTDSLVGLFICGVAGVTVAWALSVAYPVLVGEALPSCRAWPHSRHALSGMEHRHAGRHPTGRPAGERQPRAAISRHRRG